MNTEQNGQATEIVEDESVRRARRAALDEMTRTAYENGWADDINHFVQTR